MACVSTEAGRWRDLGRSCGGQQDGLWDVLPEACQRGGVWGREAGAAGSITSLIRDLTLTDGPAPSLPLSTAPPSKRQCRSLSFSDEFGCVRSPWRPAGSRVWVSVEKRRCHSGGSVQRGVAVGGAMQRSSSFSFPACSAPPELPRLVQRQPCPSFARFRPAPADPPPPRPLSLSQEQIGPPASSPDSTPELGRRAGPGGLARSRSQPCVLNEKKAGVKRRRPADRLEPRPSLDLAKMTQVREPRHRNPYPNPYP